MSEVDWKSVMGRLKKDPVFFVQKVLGGEPTVQQVLLLEAAGRPGAKVSVRSGHGTGKTTALAWLVLWFLCTRRNAKVPCTAPTQAQLRDVLWAEVGKWRERMPEWWRDQVKVSTNRVEVTGAERSQFAVARTAKPENPDALQGFHADELLFIIDEASGVYNKVFEVARGALSPQRLRGLSCVEIQLRRQVIFLKVITEAEMSGNAFIFRAWILLLLIVNIRKAWGENTGQIAMWLEFVF